MFQAFLQYSNTCQGFLESLWEITIGPELVDSQSFNGNRENLSFSFLVKSNICFTTLFVALPHSYWIEKKNPKYCINAVDIRIIAYNASYKFPENLIDFSTPLFFPGTKLALQKRSSLFKSRNLFYWKRNESNAHQPYTVRSEYDFITRHIRYSLYAQYP